MSDSSTKQTAKASGLTLLKAIAATFVLTIGLLAAVAVTGKMRSTSHRSKYMALASRVASEKLEDLTRWDPNDPNVCVPSGSTSAGSLTTDVTRATACPGGASDTVSYSDDVRMGATAEAFSETIKGVSGGSMVYVTTIHSADGSTTISTSDTPPSGSPTFHRRWIIEGNPRAGSVHRISVLVTLLDQTVQPTVRFEMSAAAAR
jgi:Tfp pilus assembly protein PilV